LRPTKFGDHQHGIGYQQQQQRRSNNTTTGTTSTNVRNNSPNWSTSNDGALRRSLREEENEGAQRRLHVLLQQCFHASQARALLQATFTAMNGGMAIVSLLLLLLLLLSLLVVVLLLVVVASANKVPNSHYSMDSRSRSRRQKF
jgi:hypothetical protein